MFKKDIDILAMRKDAELSGLMNTKKGITIFYTTYLGMDIDEAEPKIKKECMCRDIPFDNSETPSEKTIWNKADNAFESINSMAEKYPIVREAVMPMIGQILAGGATALLGVITGKKIEENKQEQSQSLDDLEISETPTNENIQDGTAGSMP